MLLAAALASAGCASRSDPLARGRRPRGERAVALAEPGATTGYARFGPGVSLRSDTPPLSQVLAEARARERALEPQYFYGPGGPGGPGGQSGETYVETTGAGCGGYAGSYFYPGGAVPPGLRPPDDAPPASPFAHALQAQPGSDSYDHRPGLSTGNGVFGRDREVGRRPISRRRRRDP